MSTVNAQIKSTSLGWEDHGIFMAWLHVEWPGAGIGFGGYSIDEYDSKIGHRIDKTGDGLEFIRAIMKTVGVEKWEDLEGKYIRIETEGWGGKAIRIGHLLEDKWFNPTEFFEAQKRVRNIIEPQKLSSRGATDVK